MEELRTHHPPSRRVEIEGWKCTVLSSLLWLPYHIPLRGLTFLLWDQSNKQRKLMEPNAIQAGAKQ